MRPAALDPLFAPLKTISGIGPKQEVIYGRLLGAQDRPARVLDLLLHLPTGVLDRRHHVRLADVVPGELVTVTVTIDRHQPPPPRGRMPYRIYAHDDSGDIIFVFFKVHGTYLERQFPVGEIRHVSGRVTLWDGMRQMAHPDRAVADDELAKLPAVEPIYPLTEGLGLKQVQNAVVAALERVRPIPEWQDVSRIAQQEWPNFVEALGHLHRPAEPADVSPASPAWQRLAFDELLAGQLALALVRADMRRPRGRAHASTGRLRKQIEAALPYALTSSQQQALGDILKDLAAPIRMLRLVQGDVGSGKTVVALLAAAEIVEAGRQAAIMAPTELLARQHFTTVAPLAERAGISCALITGREKGRERNELEARLAAGEIQIAVGTHALFQTGIAFLNLGLAVIDEQHRFGVNQRLALAQKGTDVDFLVLTATPIPRTLVLTYFGDMDVSQLTEKPPGRQPIETRTIPLSRLDDVVEAIGRAMNDGQRVYWVCPLVSESETEDVAAAEQRFAHLLERFGPRVGLVHGRMRGSEKDAVMARFASGETQLLVATTVIEVGVDVPAATVIVIEHAERFGLAQLHQLRGRVGRGSGRSTCLLLYKGPLGETAKARLTIMRETEDGFRIAEEDLKLRGEGDVLGTRQSGMPGFRVVRIEHHRKLIEAARADAMLALQRDPTLATPRGRALRTLLYLFERDEAVRLLRAG